MRTVAEIVEHAKRLSAQDRRKVVEELEESLDREAVRERAPDDGPYARSLALAGTVHSDFTDISTDKYKHVAAAAMHGHESAEGE